MNSAEIVRRLYRERQEWRSSGDGAEVSWTCRGIDIAREIVLKMAKEEQMRNIIHTPRLSIWLAGDLFRAIRKALDNLHRGERAKAVSILEDAKEMARKSRAMVPTKNGSSAPPTNVVS